MSTSYTKHQVGAKLFVIEWDLDLGNAGGNIGAPFEATDVELKSISALTSSGEGFQSFLRVSNWSTAPANGEGAWVELSVGAGNNIIPLEPVIDAPLPPMARWYYPQTLGEAPVSGVCKVALLFQEL